MLDPNDRERVESTIDLLARAQSGEAEAWSRLCARYLPRLRRWAHGRLPRRARGMLDTDDVAQEVLARTVKRLEQGEAPRAFHAYLRQALRNRIHDELRRGGLEQTAEDATLPDPGPSPLESTIGLQDLEAYESALAALDEDEREAIVARVELGMSFAEIAEALDRPSANAARMAVVRALEKLARAMTRHPRGQN
ncbi:MAG: sigma-70 family RNA polymerase sigma factor [Candidatus Eisenbacteria bacterium]